MKYLALSLFLSGCASQHVYVCRVSLWNGSSHEIRVLSKTEDNAKAFAELTHMLDAREVSCEEIK